MLEDQKRNEFVFLFGEEAIKLYENFEFDKEKSLKTIHNSVKEELEVIPDLEKAARFILGELERYRDGGNSFPLPQEYLVLYWNLERISKDIISSVEMELLNPNSYKRMFWRELCRKNFSKWWQAKTFDWQRHSKELAEYGSVCLPLWWNPDCFNWEEGSLALVTACSESFDLWWDKERFNWTWETTDFLVMFHPEKFSLWWDPEKFILEGGMNVEGLDIHSSLKAFLKAEDYRRVKDDLARRFTYLV